MKILCEHEPYKEDEKLISKKVAGELKKMQPKELEKMGWLMEGMRVAEKLFCKTQPSGWK